MNTWENHVDLDCSDLLRAYFKRVNQPFPVYLTSTKDAMDEPPDFCPKRPFSETIFAGQATSTGSTSEKWPEDTVDDATLPKCPTPQSERTSDAIDEMDDMDEPEGTTIAL